MPKAICNSRTRVAISRREHGEKALHNLGIRLSDRQMRELRARAAVMECSLSRTMRIALDSWLTWQALRK